MFFAREGKSSDYEALVCVCVLRINCLLAREEDVFSLKYYEFRQLRECGIIVYEIMSEVMPGFSLPGVVVIFMMNITSVG